MTAGQYGATRIGVLISEPGSRPLGLYGFVQSRFVDRFPWTARKVYRTRDAARADVFAYIERLYNLKRRHSKLGYLSPVEFENRATQT